MKTKGSAGGDVKTVTTALLGISRARSATSRRGPRKRVDVSIKKIVMLYSLLALALPLASGLTLNAGAAQPSMLGGVARPAIVSDGPMQLMVNRDVTGESTPAQPPALPRMELLDMQHLDMELYDMEQRLQDQWQERLMGMSMGDEDDMVHYDNDSLAASAFIRG